MKRFYLTLEVVASNTTSENEITTSLNAALDEPPCDWGEWEVGSIVVADVRHERGRE